MSTIEKHEFQAEIAQLLDIVVHSLYTDKEIFIRELISNAADATEKLRFLQTSGTEVFQPDRPLTISVNTDDTGHTISIADSGVGMTRDELIENLGTIAHSGSKAFLQQVKENAGNPSLIGQFGVGFYSSFMVGTKVTRLYPLVQARRDRLDLGVGWRELLRHRACTGSCPRDEDRYQLKGSRSRILKVASRGIHHPAILEFCWIPD